MFSFSLWICYYFHVCLFHGILLFRSFCTSFEMIRNQFGESYSSLRCETIIASFSGIFCRFALFSMRLFRNDEVIRILNCLTIFSHQFISNFKWFRKSMRMVILLSFSSISNFCLSFSVYVCFFFATRYFVEPVFLFTSIICMPNQVLIDVCCSVSDCCCSFRCLSFCGAAFHIQNAYKY